MLLRASVGMGIVIFTMAFVQNVYQLLGIRILQGVFTGYATACTILIIFKKLIKVIDKRIHFYEFFIFINPRIVFL
ncbi:TPA: hypothetical protein ACKOR7_004136 [Clostridioides difficile]